MIKGGNTQSSQLLLLGVKFIEHLHLKQAIQQIYLSPLVRVDCNNCDSSGTRDSSDGIDSTDSSDSCLLGDFRGSLQKLLP